MLHIINKSPLEKSALESCLSVATEGSTLLLIEDAVYAATRGNAFEARLQAAQGRFKICVLTPDLEARGLTEEDLLVDVTVLSRSEMGTLMEEQDVVLSF